MGSWRRLIGSLIGIEQGAAQDKEVIQITLYSAPKPVVTMCLAIPGKVEEITTEGGLRVGRVNFGGVVKRVCLDYVPEVEVGDYTIVHVGFALSKIDEETAEKTLADFREMGVLDEELGSLRGRRLRRGRLVRMGVAPTETQVLRLRRSQKARPTPLRMTAQFRYLEKSVTRSCSSK